jgi:hypothetical protein
MSERYCALPECGEPLPDHAMICYGCTAKLISALKSVPELMDDLAITFTKRSRTAQPSGPSNMEMDPVRMPFNIAAGNARAELTGILISWALLVSEERLITHVLIDADGDEIREHRKTPLTCQMTATSLSGWLLQYTGWLRHHEAAADALTEIRDAVARVRRLIDISPVMVYIGPCTAQWDDGVTSTRCTGDLWAAEGALDAVCRVCGTKWDVRTRHEANLEAARDVVAYRETVATALTANGRYLTGDLIRKWHTRGLLRVWRTDANGRKMYRLGDVKDLWDKMNDGRRP